MMRYKLLGHSGLRVSELSFGLLTFGETSGWGASAEESERMLKCYANRGGNFLDTANKYNEGLSEELTGRFVAGMRDQFVLATKFSLNMQQGDPNAGGNHRKSIMRSLEDSLKRLKTDYIDLYWLHQWDFTTHPEEVMRSLQDITQSGKVLYIGISDAPAWIVAQSNTLAEMRGWHRFVALQIEYSLIERTPERDLLPMAKSFDLAVPMWGVLGGGVLTGKYHHATNPNAPPDAKRADINTTRINQRNFQIAAAVEQVAQQCGQTSSQVALRWAVQQGQQMIPIVGARTVAQLEDNLGCLDFTLSQEHMNILNEASAIELGFPHDFLLRERIVTQRFGGTETLLDSHRILPHIHPTGTK